MKLWRVVRNRVATSLRLVAFFGQPGRWFLAPLVVVLLLAGVLLLLSSGVSFVAPFGYTLF